MTTQTRDKTVELSEKYHALLDRWDVLCQEFDAIPSAVGKSKLESQQVHTRRIEIIAEEVTLVAQMKALEREAENEDGTSTFTPDLIERLLRHDAQEVPA